MIKIIIVDYNIVSNILSGHSIISHLKHIDRSKYEVLVLLNKKTDLIHELENINIKYKIITYGRKGLINSIKDYLLIPFKVVILYFMFKPKLVHANNVMASRVSYLFKFLFGIPFLIHVRNTGLPPRTSYFFYKADKFLAVSNDTKIKTIKKDFLKKCNVVYDGIDLTKYSNEPNYFKEKKHLVIGMCGRISEQKGTDYFIKLSNSLSQRKNIKFVYAGGTINDAYGNFLSKLINMNSKNIKWLGYIEEINSFWKDVDIAIVPSNGPEALGRVVIEAMASGLPVIATSSGGPNEIIDNMKDGIIVPMNDYNTLLSKLYLLIENRNMRITLGKNARIKVFEKFSSKSYSKRIFDEYRTTLQ